MDVAYTCVVGDYDRLREDAARTSSAIDAFVCFGDDATRPPPPPWRQQPLDARARQSAPREVNRWHKLFPHELLPAARASVYRDGNLRLEQDYGDYIAVLRRSGAALGAFRHPAGRSVAEEVNSARAQDRFTVRDLERVDAQLARYAREGFDLETPISANYLLVRDHEHPLLADAMQLWWQQLANESGRDQISLQYVVWKSRLPFIWLDDHGLVPPIRDPHRGERWRKRWTRLTRLLRGQP